MGPLSYPLTPETRQSSRTSSTSQDLRPDDPVVEKAGSTAGLSPTQLNSTQLDRRAVEPGLKSSSILVSARGRCSAQLNQWLETWTPMVGSIHQQPLLEHLQTSPFNSTPAQSPLYGPIQQQALFEHLGYDQLHSSAAPAWTFKAGYIRRQLLHVQPACRAGCKSLSKSFICWQPLLENPWLTPSLAAPAWTYICPLPFVSSPWVPAWTPMARNIHQQPLFKYLRLARFIGSPCLKPHDQLPSFSSPYLKTHGHLHSSAASTWTPISSSVDQQPLLEHLWPAPFVGNPCLKTHRCLHSLAAPAWTLISTWWI